MLDDWSSRKRTFGRTFDERHVGVGANGVGRRVARLGASVASESVGVGGAAPIRQAGNAPAGRAGGAVGGAGAAVAAEQTRRAIGVLAAGRAALVLEDRLARTARLDELARTRSIAAMKRSEKSPPGRRRRAEVRSAWVLDASTKRITGNVSRRFRGVRSPTLWSRPARTTSVFASWPSLPSRSSPSSTPRTSRPRAHRARGSSGEPGDAVTVPRLLLLALKNETRGHGVRGGVAPDDARGRREARARPPSRRRSEALSDDRGAPRRARGRHEGARPARGRTEPAAHLARSRSRDRGARGRRSVHARSARRRAQRGVRALLSRHGDDITARSTRTPSSPTSVTITSSVDGCSSSSRRPTRRRRRRAKRAAPCSRWPRSSRRSRV